MDILISLIVLLSCIGGIILSLFNLPGIWLVFSGILLAAWQDNFVHYSLFFVIGSAFLSIFVSVADSLAMILGGNKFGSTKWGVVGALVGGFLGIFMGGLLGILVGCFLGSVFCELIFANREYKDALRSGIGTALGFIIGVVFKLGSSIALSFMWAYLCIQKLWA